MLNSGHQARELHVKEGSAVEVRGVARIGRPPSKAARSHAAVMDAVYALLQETSARHLTMEAVANRANVGRPTLYKWWPSKAALLMAMFHERLAEKPQKSSSTTVEAALVSKMRRLITSLNGLFGKVMMDLIAEAQSDPKLLEDLHDHIRVRRVQSVMEIEQGKASGEFRRDVKPEVVVDMLLGPLYYRLLLGFRPLTHAYANQLTREVLQAIRAPAAQKRAPAAQKIERSRAKFSSESAMNGSRLPARSLKSVKRLRSRTGG